MAPTFLLLGIKMSVIVQDLTFSEFLYNANHHPDTGGNCPVIVTMYPRRVKRIRLAF